jgi:hypothetical protein
LEVLRHIAAHGNSDQARVAAAKARIVRDEIFRIIDSNDKVLVTAVTRANIAW